MSNGGWGAVKRRPRRAPSAACRKLSPLPMPPAFVIMPEPALEEKSKARMHTRREESMEAAARSMSENIRRCFHLLLEIIARKSNRTLSKYLRQNNIPPRLYEIMTFISPRPQNQAVISERLQINKNVMVRLIDELEERGLCLRVQKPGLRRREYNIQLTAKGSKALRDCEKLVRESEGELLSGLTQEERKELCRLLEKSLETELSP